MAEFLIYNKTHWSENVSEEDRAKWSEAEADRLSRTFRKGDFVEAQEDGFFSKRGFDKESFCLLCIPKMTKEEGLQYVCSLTEERYALVFDDKTMTHSTVPYLFKLKKRKFALDPKSVTLDAEKTAIVEMLSKVTINEKIE